MAKPRRFGRSSMINSTELYACLHVKEFPAQALLRLRPELHGKPCVVLEGEAPLQKVCSLNTSAWLRGLVHGMTLVEVETFPVSAVLPRSLKAESLTKAALLECAGAFSPRVEDCSKDTKFLCGIDIAGTGNLFGPPETLAKALLMRVRSLGISAQIVISHNLHAAISLARGMSSSVSTKVISAGEEASVLAPLPLQVLLLTESQAETFSMWGIYTLGMLADLPERELISRMGQDSKRIRLLARGEWQHLFQPVEPTFSLVERKELDTPEDRLDGLLFGIAVLLDQLIVRAKARIVALASVTITLWLDGGGTYARTVRPALPTTDKQLWIRLIHLDLDAHPPMAAILTLELEAEAGSTSKLQLGLFSPQLPEPGRLDVTLAQIRALVGEDCVGRAVLQDTHAQESFRMEPFTVSTKDSGLSLSAEPKAVMRQLRPPESVTVALQDHRPTGFFFRQTRYTVDQSYGPWRVSGDWWSKTLWGHEQWDLVARAQDGSLLCGCIMRDLMRNAWQMAALYD
jgi:protein ImuB